MCYFDYNYDAASRITRITRENGGIIYYGYDDADRLTSEEWRSSDNSLIYAFAWDYDPVGNRTYQSQIGFNGGTSVAPAQTYYDYDAANQLTRSRQINGDSPGWTYYEYDTRGNCLLNHGPLGAQYFTYDDRNLVSSIRFRDGSSTHFEHDAQMRLAAMTELPSGGASQTTYYTWDSPSTGLGSGGMNLLAERDEAGDVTARYVHGHTPIDGSGSTVAATKSTPSGDATQLYLYNHHGDVMAVLDETGSPLAAYAYTAWGQPLSPAPMIPGNNRLRWQANWMYLKEGVYISRARAYDSNTGRFGQRDPINGVTGLHSYPYVKLEATDAVDPDGEVMTRLHLYPYFYSSLLGGIGLVGPDGERIDSLLDFPGYPGGNYPTELDYLWRNTPRRQRAYTPPEAVPPSLAPLIMGPNIPDYSSYDTPFGLTGILALNATNPLDVAKRAKMTCQGMPPGDFFCGMVNTVLEMTRSKPWYPSFLPEREPDWSGPCPAILGDIRRSLSGLERSQDTYKNFADAAARYKQSMLNRAAQMGRAGSTPKWDSEMQRLWSAMQECLGGAAQAAKWIDEYRQALADAYNRWERSNCGEELSCLVREETGYDDEEPF